MTRLALMGTIIAVVASISAAAVRPEPPAAMVVGKRYAYIRPVVVGLADGLRKSLPKAERGKLTVGPYNHATVGRFADDDNPFNVVAVTTWLDDHSRKCLARRFPAGSPQAQAFLVGQR